MRIYLLSIVYYLEFYCRFLCVMERDFQCDHSQIHIKNNKDEKSKTKSVQLFLRELKIEI